MQFFIRGLDARRKVAAVDRQRWAGAFLDEWREMVVYLAPVLKDPAFASEREWRLIVSLGSTDLTNVKIKQRQALISRHLPLAFGPRIPLKGVMVRTITARRRISGQRSDIPPG